MLFEAGYAVICVCRGIKQPYREHAAWGSIAYVHADRAAEEGTGAFGERIARLAPDVVIDLTCYYPHSAQQLVEALRGRVKQFLHCGTIWVHGHSVAVPVTEDAPRQPFGDYGIRKAAIETWLLSQFKETGFPATVLHPGHLVGPGWTPINPTGNFNPSIYSALMHGAEVRIPNFGMEMVHHVHVEDVAQAFLKAMQNPESAVGQSFHTVSDSALTLRGYAELMAAWFNQPAHLQFLSWEEWKKGVSERDAAVTEDHIRHSPNCSIQKARKLLGFAPRHTSLEAVQESVAWLLREGVVV
jgi:nucleoside-diphosphate-sugar epimerase